MTIQLYPGEWRTRDGRKVTVYFKPRNMYPWTNGSYTWGGDGFYHGPYQPHDLDIIAQWHEPAKPHPLIFGGAIVGNEPIPKPPEDTRPVLRLSMKEFESLIHGDYVGARLFRIDVLRQACDQQGIKLEII